MVSMPRASEFLVGAWANYPKHAQWGRYLESKWVMVPAPAHMLQEILSLQQPYMGKRSRLAAECCFHKFFLGVEGRCFSRRR